MSDADKKLQARGGEMGDDTDDFLAWLDSLPKEPNDTVKAAFAAYKATVKPAPDLAELVEAAVALSDAYRTWSLIPRRSPGEKQAFAQMHSRKTALDAALAKIKEPQT